MIVYGSIEDGYADEHRLYSQNHQTSDGIYKSLFYLLYFLVKISHMLRSITEII